MSNIDKRALREAAERAKDNFIPCFRAPTRDVLALLDELEAKDRRIEEEIARANREHHRGFMMACGHLKEHSNVHYADAAEMEIAALRNRINELESAAAGKGGAS
ncbi:ead/Ea22-like family protein [Enterobacter hormaechei]|nr:ead/Ea22-like family protein [Enterobacter hormaechei subsp. xiangfangensis]